MDVVREYLRLGLQFARLVDGFVDAYTGDPALRREVGNAPAPDPAALARRGVDVVGADLNGADMERTADEINRDLAANPPGVLPGRVVPHRLDVVDPGQQH